ncbi:MAG: flagellar biosynthesis protein FlhF [Geobacteraceae bacterium]|nr:flagellar biosynthesis protein FlhF [Geobacteraceae bacterium]
MQTRTFQAANMTEAMHLVKAELGPDAMIVSSRRERRKGILGLFGRPVFSITAALAPAPARRPASPMEYASVEESTRDEFRKSMLEPLARELKDLRERVDSLFMREKAERRNRTSLEPGGMINEGSFRSVETQAGGFGSEDKQVLRRGNPEGGKREETAPAPLKFRSFDSLPEENVVDGIAGGKNDNAALAEVSAALHEAGVNEATIRTLAGKAKANGIQLTGSEDLRGKLKESIETAVKCTGSIRMKRNGARIVALVGPTGVGKTTTVAKLAAHYTLERKARVALITIDTFRVGAVEQLKTYSRIMGVPLEVASTPGELQKALELHADKDLVIIDTVGRSPRDTETIERLREMLQCTQAIEIHLCVAATTRESELRSIVKGFGMLPVSRLLFTKLDESSSFGSIINLQIENKLPLSYFTRGQRVPEDIEPATSRKVAELLLGQ